MLLNFPPVPNEYERRYWSEILAELQLRLRHVWGEDNKWRNHVFTLENFRKGVTAPVDATVGTTPSIPALYFSATNELISTYITLHEAWDKSESVKLELFWALASAETNGDELSTTIDYIVTKEHETGSGVNKTSTQILSSHALTTAMGLAVGDLHPMTYTFDKDDANNGYVPGDNSIGIGFELHLTNTTGVADIYLVGGHLNYKALY